MKQELQPMDPEGQLGYLLVRAAEQVARPWRAALKNAGINPRQFSVLAWLARDPGLPAAELARRVLVTPQSMSESLVALADAGLLTRDGGGAGRPLEVHLTAAGKRLLREAYPHVIESNRTSFAALTEPERSKLATLLRKLVA